MFYATVKIDFSFCFIERTLQFAIVLLNESDDHWSFIYANVVCFLIYFILIFDLSNPNRIIGHSYIHLVPIDSEKFQFFLKRFAQSIESVTISVSSFLLINFEYGWWSKWTAKVNITQPLLPRFSICTSLFGSEKLSEFILPDEYNSKTPNN